MANILTKLFQPGFRTINGSHLNDWAQAINNAFNGLTAWPLAATTLSASGNITANAFFQSGTATGLTAAGTTRANALALTKAINVITTAAASTGAVLPSAATVGVGGSVIVFNDGASAIKVYAAGSDTIDTVAGATGVTLSNAKRCEYWVTAALTWESAQLGVVSA